MKHSLTIVYTTGRPEPKFEWFMDSLHNQMMPNETIDLIFVSFFEVSSYKDIFSKISPRKDGINKLSNIRIVKPKPSLWQGEHKITRDEWWAASNARNTGICLCKTEWIAFVDDRCVLTPTWLQAIREAMDKNYAVCGAYEKRHSMTVENGAIKHGGIVTGRDNREIIATSTPFPCGGEWWYGCTNALPMEWVLKVGGYEQLMDGLSFEDVIFGLMLQNNGYPIRYDTRMKMVEDRSQDALGMTFKRTDKGELGTVKDKSHASLYRFGKALQTTNRNQLLESRAAVLAGNPFPTLLDPDTDWFDGKPIRDF